MLRNAPIRQKLVFLTVGTTAVALLLAGAGIVGLDAYFFGDALQRDLTAQARIVGDNSTAALDFDDPGVARDTLNALRARPHIVGACLYRTDGELFARYARPGSSGACPPPAKTEQSRVSPNGLALSHPIFLQGRRLGTLTLLYDSGEIQDRIKLYTLVVGGVFLASSLIAFLLASRLRSIIAAPIARLAGAVKSISESGDYSIRVAQDSTDELGVLVEGFNAMLGRIESRDVALHEARQSLETTLNSIGDAVIATGGDGRIGFANPVARALLRLRQDEIVGRHIDEVFRIVHEYTGQALESPVRQVAREGRIVNPAETAILRSRDGIETPIDHSAAPIWNEGAISGVVVVFRDITERRRAQQDAAYLAAIVESTDDAIASNAPDGSIQTWNAGAERLYGYRADEIVGRAASVLLPPDRRHEESEFLEQLRAGRGVAHFETVRLRKDGSPVDVSLTISPIRDKAGRIIGMSQLARDITEQKRAAEQMRETQKLESLGVLAGGIAHDFNNLLTGILGNASLVLNMLPEDSTCRPPLDDVVAASERAARLAQQMLAYSGKGRFVVERLDLSAVVRDTVPLIRASIPPTVDLQLRLDDGLPGVDGDLAQMQQVVMNIIINAGEAIPEGKAGTVRVATRSTRVGAGERADIPEGSYVVFEVTDTGNGMDDETRSRIFDPFFTTKFTGRGLGLAAVLGIVRGHKGTVEVVTAPGKGTTFRVLFPALSERAAVTEVARNFGEAPVSGEGAVLVVDDEQVVRTLAQQSLRRHGYEVLLAENGARGLDIYRSAAERIRCVILDLTMPVMGGEETLARMKAFRDDIPIILSSGFHEAEALERFKGKGLAAFLQKPYRTAGLIDVVRRVAADGSAQRTAASEQI